jgi:imidazoleglycerol-phosphate dehydratase
VTPRRSDIRRNTRETQIDLSLYLDGSGHRDNRTPVPFLNHMLDAFARHGIYDLTVSASGDVEVDPHHTVEDVGLVLGGAFKEALGDGDGVVRYGWATIPMDETLARSVVDCSGRFYFHLEGTFSRADVGDLPTEMVVHFWYSLAEHAGLNLHMDLIRGTNAHHQVEALFKASARALKAAVRRRTENASVPSTKGTLE